MPSTTDRSVTLHALATVLVLSACGEGGSPVAARTSLSAAAEEYLTMALDVMEEHSVKRYEVNWPLFRAETLHDAAGAETPSDTYEAIRSALDRLGDNHSFFVAPTAPAASRVPVNEFDPANPSLGSTSGIGYLEVTPFSGSGAAADSAASRYHQLVEERDAASPCGWIVDLRGNTGGNMWVMLAGVGPLLDGTTVGSFVDPDSVVEPWFYRDGRAGYGSRVVVEVIEPYRLADETAAVAVLTDGMTASAGEAIAIAFRADGQSRSFGEPTMGLTTANEGFRLPDGAWIFLSVSTMADRSGRIYGSVVVPDVEVEGRRTGDPATDAPVRAAIEWLSAEPPCTDWTSGTSQSGYQRASGSVQ